MTKTKTASKMAGIGDDAVAAATGKNWKQWLWVLDKAGAKNMTHKEIVAEVRDRHGIGPWWQQMVTVGYEQARGLRQKHELADGYKISRSKTVGVSLSQLYAAWHDAKLRDRWLNEGPLVIRKATRNKSMRITWCDKKTSVEVNFYAKGSAKAQVAVEHNKLPDAKRGEQMKKFWGKTLDRLKKSVETQARFG